MRVLRFLKNITNSVEGYNHVRAVVVVVDINSLVELKVEDVDDEDVDILLEQIEPAVLVLKPFIIKNLNEKKRTTFLKILQFLLDHYFA
jgi:hypothetical protein